jgi:hypothetical protein
MDRDHEGIHGNESLCYSILNSKGIPPHGSSRDLVYQISPKREDVPYRDKLFKLTSSFFCGTKI